jgi:hypothetical protein
MRTAMFSTRPPLGGHMFMMSIGDGRMQRLLSWQPHRATAGAHQRHDGDALKFAFGA